jgi:hypothetical protein
MMAETAKSWSGIILGTTSKANYQRIARSFNVVSKQTNPDDRHLLKMPSVHQAELARDQLYSEFAPPFQQSSRSTTTYSITIGNLTFKSASTIVITNLIVEAEPCHDTQLLNWIAKLLVESRCTVCPLALESRRKAIPSSKQLIHIRVGFKSTVDAQLASHALKLNSTLQGITLHFTYFYSSFFCHLL